MSKRKANFEILRILAMFMVLVLHYLDKGGILPSLTEPFEANDYVVYLLECFAIVAVNVYVLITGYFMCESNMKISRVLQILCQVMWYMLLIPVVLTLLGQAPLAEFTTYDWLKIIFPVHMKHYWFVTSYIVLMLFVPFINQAIKHMKQKQHLVAMLLLLLYQMFPKSILPVAFTDDDMGYGPLWMICLYLIAAYIRRYGIPFFSSRKKSLLCYLAGTLLIWCSILVMQQVYFRLDAFGERMNFGLHYNHLFCLFSSVALFYTFVHWQPADCGAVRFLTKVAPYTFGVYLLHEHNLVAYNWTKWLQVTPSDHILVTIVFMLVKCGFVLVVGIFLDWLRSLVFKGVGKLLVYTSIPSILQKLDACLQGEH